MNDIRQKYGEWACVMGAAEGLGKSFAVGLAKRGFHLILVDYDEEKLKRTSSQLVVEYRIETHVMLLDLVEVSSADGIINAINDHVCRLLIYNAAYGPVKPFLSNSEEDLQRYISVNIKTQLHLIHRFIRLYKDHNAGIMLVSSLAGFRGTQFVIPYAATKAFIWNLAEGLHYEFQNSGIDISVCVAGATDTPAFRSTHPKKWLLSPKPRSPQLVADESLRKLGKQLFIVPGISNKISHFILNRILPRSIASQIHNLTMKKMYQ